MELNQQGRDAGTNSGGSKEPAADDRQRNVDISTSDPTETADARTQAYRKEKAMGKRPMMDVDPDEPPRDVPPPPPAAIDLDLNVLPQPPPVINLDPTEPASDAPVPPPNQDPIGLKPTMTPPGHGLQLASPSQPTAPAAPVDSPTQLTPPPPPSSRPVHRQYGATASDFGNIQDPIPLPCSSSPSTSPTAELKPLYQRKEFWQMQRTVNDELWGTINALIWELAECKTYIGMPLSPRPALSLEEVGLQPSYKEGTIKPPAYLSEEKQRKWMDLETENLKLGKAIDDIRADLAACQRKFLENSQAGAGGSSS